MAFGRSDGPHLAVDVLVAGTPFEAAALSRRRRLTLFGVPVFAAAPDDLIVYKLVAGRPQDAADVDRLLRAGIAPEDDANVRHWAREWDVEPAWDRALEASRRDGVGED